METLAFGLKLQLMRYDHLCKIYCPICSNPLQLSYAVDNENKTSTKELKSGLLQCSCSMMYPLVDGVARMLLESHIDHKDFLNNTMGAHKYNECAEIILKKHGAVVHRALERNANTKKSFAYEWGILKAEDDDKIWHVPPTEMTQVFLDEFELKLGQLSGKEIVDIGSGHGEMTQRMAALTEFALGVELTTAVDKAYQKNQSENILFVQADLQHLPLAANSFDFLYSSGVIHHTESTKKAMKLISPVLRPSGKISLWLYHPRNNIVHKIFLGIRSITKRMPLKVAIAFLSIFILPPSFIIKQFRRQKARPNLREELINLLDFFTPEFREEIPFEESAVWLREIGYKDVVKTTEDEFGYSMVAIKNA